MFLLYYELHDNQERCQFNLDLQAVRALHLCRYVVVTAGNVQNKVKICYLLAHDKKHRRRQIEKSFSFFKKFLLSARNYEKRGDWKNFTAIYLSNCEFHFKRDLFLAFIINILSNFFYDITRLHSQNTTVQTIDIKVTRIDSFRQCFHFRKRSRKWNRSIESFSVIKFLLYQI